MVTIMIEWGKHTWTEIKNNLERIKAVILPVGSTEQHGPHLPLTCDSIFATQMSLEVAKHFNGSILVLPPIYYGVSEHHMDFSGTITISNDTLISLVYEIARSVWQFGVKKFIIINGHGGNKNALSIAIRKIREEIGMDAVLINPYELINDVIAETIESRVWGHACEFETSVALIKMPELIRRDKIIDPKIKETISYTSIWEKNIVITPWRTSDFTDTGSIGYPTKATKEKGEKLWTAMLSRVVEFIEEFIKKI